MTYRDRFLEEEKRATELATKLTELKKEIEGYQKAKGTLIEVQQEILMLTSQISASVEEQNQLVAAIKEIDTQKVLDEVEGTINELKTELGSSLISLDEKIEEKNTELESSLLSINEKIMEKYNELDQRSKTLHDNLNRIEKWGRMLLFGIIGLNIIIGILLFVLK